MSVMSEEARSKAKDKVERLTRTPKGDLDASGWREPLGEKGEIQTGMRVLSRKNYASGGKVEGAKPMAHAGRKPRASGGKALTATSLINRDVKEANQSRDGEKHDGGMKKGGRVHKLLGGGMLHRPGISPVRLGNARPGLGTHPGMGVRPFAAGGKVHGKDCTCAKCSGGRVAKKSGGSINDGTRPEGGRIARKEGGRAKKGMNVNIVIAPQGGGARPPMPMPPPGAGGPVGMHQGVPPPMPPPGAAPPMGPPPMMRKSGGRVDSSGPTAKAGKYPIKDGAGGGLGRREKIRAYG